MEDFRNLADPRMFPDPRGAPPSDARLYSLATQSLAADSRPAAGKADLEIREILAVRLASDGAALAALFAGAPSVAVTRHLWRQLDVVWRRATESTAGVAITLFALPVVIVSAVERGSADVMHPAVVKEPETLAAILREHGALDGNETFALGNALVTAEAIDLPRLPDLLAWQRLPDSKVGDFLPRVLEPAPLAFPAGGERVHVRFLVGSALARSGCDVVSATTVGAWGVPFVQVLSRELATAESSVLALARVPARPLQAVRAGRMAQREVGAQVFASNAIRKLRASVGEPTAVISAHLAPDTPGGGELRLSLSSSFAPRDAEGFRCPLYPLDRVGDVASMLFDLMADCRVTDVRVVAGVHADRDPVTGLTLLFKPDALPDPAAVH